MAPSHSSSPLVPHTSSELKGFRSHAEVQGSRQTPALQGLISLGQVHVAQALRETEVQFCPTEVARLGGEGGESVEQ